MEKCVFLCKNGIEIYISMTNNDLDQLDQEVFEVMHYIIMNALYTQGISLHPEEKKGLFIGQLVLFSQNGFSYSHLHCDTL